MIHRKAARSAVPPLGCSLRRSDPVPDRNDTRIHVTQNKTERRPVDEVEVRKPGASLAAFLLLLSSASAGPPFITDDPEPVDYLHWELYTFSLGTHAMRDTSGVAPSCDCNYGGLPNVQLHFQPGPTGDAARGLGTGRTHAFVPLWVQKDFGDWTTYGGGGYWINPGPGNKNFWFTGWVLQRKITGKLALGIELFHQTPNEIGRLQSTSFDIGGRPSTDDFTDHYHFLFSFGRGLQHAKQTNEFSWYIGFLVTGGGEPPKSHEAAP
jgi:hypothetical protein